MMMIRTASHAVHVASGVQASLHVLKISGWDMHRQLCCCFRYEYSVALNLQSRPANTTKHAAAHPACEDDVCLPSFGVLLGL